MVELADLGGVEHLCHLVGGVTREPADVGDECEHERQVGPADSVGERRAAMLVAHGHLGARAQPQQQQRSAGLVGVNGAHERCAAVLVLLVELCRGMRAQLCKKVECALVVPFLCELVQHRLPH